MMKMLLRSRIEFALTLFSMLMVVSANCAFAQTVKMVQGRVSGIMDTDSGVTVFKGIPFAAPPIGSLRWRAPQPPLSWEGVRKADAFGASCMQPIIESMLPMHMPWTEEFLTHGKTSEDCLYLNVWTPKISAKSNLPVIVFIHGGGFTGGAGSIAIYDGENLAAKGVVVVTINYRLGVFGFLASPELTAESKHHSSGNYGLLDQIAALEWVRANIAQFGGDPHRVTIWGQSAGAFSVAALVASPLAKDLFARAQADSGIGIAGLPMPDLKMAEDSGIKFATEHHAATIKELRAMSAESLLPAPGAQMEGIRFSPIVDGWVLPDTPNAMSEKGTDNDVPVITGYQAGDSALFTQPVHSQDEYRTMIKNRYGEMADEFNKLYPVTKSDEIGSATKTSNQDRDRVSMFLWASARVKTHQHPVFTYYFDHAIPWPEHPEFGAFHTGEIPYYFLNLQTLKRPWKQADSTLAETTSSYLINFAEKGDPNGAGLAHWPRINPSEPETMELGERCGAMPLADHAKLEFWIRYFNSPEGRHAPPF